MALMLIAITAVLAACCIHCLYSHCATGGVGLCWDRLLSHRGVIGSGVPGELWHRAVPTSCCPAPQHSLHCSLLRTRLSAVIQWDAEHLCGKKTPNKVGLLII